MNALRSKGRIVVTNHGEPEAVIVPVAEYEAIMQFVEQAEAQIELTIANLRRTFDERLSVLQDRSAATRLQATMSGCAKLAMIGMSRKTLCGKQ